MTNFWYDVIVVSTVLSRDNFFSRHSKIFCIIIGQAYLSSVCNFSQSCPSSSLQSVASIVFTFVPGIFPGCENTQIEFQNKLFCDIYYGKRNRTILCCCTESGCLSSCMCIFAKSSLLKESAWLWMKQHKNVVWLLRVIITRWRLCGITALFSSQKPLAFLFG